MSQKKQEQLVIRFTLLTPSEAARGRLVEEFRKWDGIERIEQTYPGSRNMYEWELHMAYLREGTRYSRAEAIVKSMCTGRDGVTSATVMSIPRP